MGMRLVSHSDGGAAGMGGHKGAEKGWEQKERRYSLGGQVEGQGVVGREGGAEAGVVAGRAGGRPNLRFERTAPSALPLKRESLGG